MKEYKHFNIRHPAIPLEEELNKLAKQEWEVVAMTTTGDYFHILLVREKNEGPRLA